MRQMSLTWMAESASLLLLPTARAEERRVLGRLLQACRLDVGRDHLLQVVAHGDFAGLAAFFLEAEHPLVVA